MDLGGLRTAAAGRVLVEGVVLTVGVGLVVVLDGVVTLSGVEPGLPGCAAEGAASPMTITPATSFLASNMRL